MFIKKYQAFLILFLWFNLNHEKIPNMDTKFLKYFGLFKVQSKSLYFDTDK